MTTVPNVAVIVLNWNGWKDTLECLSSLEKLDYPNYEMVVVDNGSTDRSEDKIREAYPGVSLIETGTNLGFAGGNNVGVSYALQHGADYVWLLNNDTVADESCLARMVELAEADSSVGAVGSVLYEMHEKDSIQTYGGGRVLLWMGITRYFTSPVPDEDVHYLTGASLLVRREALEDVGFLDDRFFMYWEDTDYGLRLRKAGWKLAVAPEAKLWHKEFAGLGRKSVALDNLFNFSAVLLFKRHHVFPIVPVLIGAGGRFLKRLMRGDFQRAAVVVKSTLRGWGTRTKD